MALDESETSCCYAVQDKVWVDDPAGNRWEVYTVLEDVEHDENHQGEPSAAACCSGTTACCT